MVWKPVLTNRKEGSLLGNIEGAEMKFKWEKTSWVSINIRHYLMHAFYTLSAVQIEFCRKSKSVNIETYSGKEGAIIKFTESLKWNS